jgi:hypothetical protein
MENFLFSKKESLFERFFVLKDPKVPAFTF